MVRKGVRIALLLVLAVFFIGFVSSASCSITTSCAAANTVMRLSSSSNAHGELYSGSAYSYYLCCDFTGTHTCSGGLGGNKVLSLSSATNAHAETPTQYNYNYDVCFGALTCTTTTSSCPANYPMQMVSLSSSTNAHIGTFSTYSTNKICCNANLGPVQTYGNGIIEGTEQCDGSNFGGKTCATQLGAGYTGTLTCSAPGVIGTSNCIPPCSCGTDNNVCTTDACVAGVCQHTPVSAGTACTSDGNECTNDVCSSSGTCVHNAKTGSSCSSDGNPCTNDICSALGVCTHNALTGTACTSDNDACTNDVCSSSGNCVHNIITSCINGDGCCPSACSSSTDNDCTMCTVANQASKCTGGNLCTTHTCLGGTCVYNPIAGCCTSSSQCSDSNVCTTDICLSNSCSHSAISGCCTSSSQCSGSQTCVGNVCTSPSSICGDGVRQGSEGCDDGNTANGDGCSSSCNVESGWTCNTATPNVCTRNCVPSCSGKTCGSDGCGTNNNCGTCSGGQICQSGTCVPNGLCGNGICDSGETCSSCSTDCGCSGGQTCQSGTCVSSVSCGDGTCNNGETCSSCSTDCTWNINTQECVNGNIVSLCDLTSATWSQTSALENDLVRLNLNGTNCEGKKIIFEVMRRNNALLGLGQDIPAATNPLPITFNSPDTYGTWTAEWVNNYNPLRYYFIATVEGTSITITSSKTEEDMLHVYQSDVVCAGVNSCSNYKTESDCQTNLCTVADVPSTITCGGSFNTETGCYDSTNCGCSWDSASGTCAATWNSQSSCGVCGNHIRDAGEQCDDGNTMSGDGCSSTCQFESGINSPCSEGLTLCSDGTCSLNCDITDTSVAPCNYNGVCDSGEGCTCSDCNGEQDTCQNGLLCTIFNTACCTSVSDGSCNPYCSYVDPDCSPGVCGNGFRETGEECDLGTRNGQNSGCLTDCTYEIIPGPPCPEGTALCNDGTCSLNCYATDQGVATCDNSKCAEGLQCSGVDQNACCHAAPDGYCNPYCASVDQDCKSAGTEGLFPFGTCSYTENGQNTCQNDGILVRSLIASWTWAPENPSHSDPLGRSQNCVNIEDTLACPASVQVSFFGIYQLAIAAVVILLIYLIWALRKKNNSKHIRRNSKIKVKRRKK